MRISDWSSDVCSSDLFGQAAFLDRGLDRAADQQRRAGMRGVAFDDDGAARGERRGSVAAGDREGEREVRRAEHRDGAERDAALAQIGARQRSEEHTSELQSLMRNSYAVFCLKKKKYHNN